MAAAGTTVVAVGVGILVSAHRLPATFSVAATTSAAPAESDSPSVVASSSGPTPTATTTAPFRPTSVVLTAFDVTAPVDPVLTSGDTVLTPPSDPARIGWWAASSLSGSAGGPTVLVGHVDGPDGPGALYRLVHARAGDRITVAGDNGSRVTYAVTSLQYHTKGHPLAASLFAPAGPPRLVVISCGGPFDRSTDQYEDNVVVEATPT